MSKKDIKAEAVDEALQEKMAQKMERDFEGNDWYGATLDAGETPLLDPGTGKPVLIRVFDFQFDNKIRLRDFPSKQELFNAHAKQIMTLLWGDGLRPYEGENPRVTIDRRRRTYRIIVVAEPRLNTVVIERPESLNTMLAKSSKGDGTSRHQK